MTENEKTLNHKENKQQEKAKTGKKRPGIRRPAVKKAVPAKGKNAAPAVKAENTKEKNAPKAKTTAKAAAEPKAKAAPKAAAQMEQKAVSSAPAKKPHAQAKSVRRPNPNKRRQAAPQAVQADKPFVSATLQLVGKKPPTMRSKASEHPSRATLRMIPLGGMCEIGKNMTAYEYGNDIIIVDCGQIFPDETMPGVDAVIPDFTYVLQNRDRVRGIFITHGHEDHIGGLPYLMREFKAPIYGGKMAVELLKYKLDDKVPGLTKSCTLRAVEAGDTVRAGCFAVEFIHVNHSIADAFMFAIKTPIGTIVHSGDFKIAGPFGILGVYLVFHVLDKMIKEDNEQKADSCCSTYQDEECTVTSEDEAERMRRKAQPAPDYEIPFDESANVDDVIRAGYAAMRRIRQANDIIEDEELSRQIDSIETSCGQILSILEQRPQLLSQLRTFLRYYLPTTLKLLEARAKLEDSARTPKAREVRTRISEAVGAIDKAFLKQADALDAYRFIDLESEIDVLRDMLRADGLIDEEKDDDPFCGTLNGH